MNENNNNKIKLALLIRIYGNDVEICLPNAEVEYVCSFYLVFTHMLRLF